MTQHAGLGEERWADFELDQQLLMIGNEMNRASRAVARMDVEALRRGYERVLRLVDLTVAAAPRPALRRELLRWREVLAGLYLEPAPDAPAHRTAFRTLLLMSPGASRQVRHLVPHHGAPRTG